MRRESSSPFTRPVPLPLWAAVAIPVSVAVVAGLAGMMAGIYIGLSGYDAPGTPDTAPATAAPDAKPTAKADVRSYLRDPINRKAFEQVVMGKSTREVTEMLGPPSRVMNNLDAGLGWVYETPPVTAYQKSKRQAGNVILILRSDHVAQIVWNAAI